MNKSKIEWTDQTWNPVTGCTKISQGCKNCYAERMHERFNGKGSFKKVELKDDRVDQPIHWKKPSKIFVNSMSDLFHDDVPFEFVDQCFVVMQLASWHTFQVLTKRPDRAREYFWWKQDGKGIKFSVWPLMNVWIGTSCENQAMADERIPALSKIPAVIHFLSCEPLLSRIDISKFQNIQWVICGGESGPGARMMHPDWVRSLRDQCAAASIPFFFKQWGEYLPLEFYVQPPFRFFSNSGKLIDGHGIEVINPEDPLGKPGKFQGHRFVDAMDSIVFCVEVDEEHCDFLKRSGKGMKWAPKIDGKKYTEFPIIRRWLPNFQLLNKHT